MAVNSVWVALGLGSNDNAAANLASALEALLLRFNDLQLSSVFQSRARDGAAPDYLNMAVGFDTDLPLAELAALVTRIEDKQRRDRASPASRLITLDIDILLYGDLTGTYGGIELPRGEILSAAYVLWPLSQIAGKRKHPVLKTSYAELWRAFDKAQQHIAPVAFEWHGRVISREK